MTAPRVLCIMGSGETAPTMSAVHAELLSLARVPPRPGVLLDTPFGFQENADELVARARAYFRKVAGAQVGVASLRSVEGAGAVEVETALTRLREAAWIFSGPGSPSYALRQWSSTQVPSLLRRRLDEGGCVLVFSSAAACTIGCVALPVYEIYKVGERTRWLPGLDLLALCGLRCAVVPHYDNAEGGTHDTRFCYMGERRLRALEDELPEGAAILGVTEHTAAVLDLEADTATVRGRGHLVIRRRGAETLFPAGGAVPIARLRAAAEGAAEGGAEGAAEWAAEGAAAPGTCRPCAASWSGDAGVGATAGNPLLERLAALRDDFAAGRSARDVDGMLRSILELDDLIVDWLHDSLQSDAGDRARGELRGMVVALGDVARRGARDPRDVLAPYLELVVRLRDAARREGRFAQADALRGELRTLGVELRDRPDGTDWLLAAEDAAAP